MFLNYICIFIYTLFELEYKIMMKNFYESGKIKLAPFALLHPKPEGRRAMNSGLKVFLVAMIPLLLFALVIFVFVSFCN